MIHKIAGSVVIIIALCVSFAIDGYLDGKEKAEFHAMVRNSDLAWLR